MKAVDLHVHSTYSDGTDTPRELVELAIKSQLSAFALTDHDTVNGVSEAVNEGTIQGIEVIPGVEISTNFDRTEIHIVGLFIDYNNAEFKDFLDAQLISRINRNKKICEKFQELGIDITYENMLSSYESAVLTRAHFADKLMTMGVVNSRNEAFDRFLKPSQKCYVPRHKVDPREAIEMIHKADGLAILAHPILYHLGNEQMNKLMDYLCDAGIDGIEALYSTYGMGDELSVRKIATQRNLLISGGSDYHGKNKPHISLGKGMGHLFIPKDIVYEMKKHLKTQT